MKLFHHLHQHFLMRYFHRLLSNLCNDLTASQTQTCQCLDEHLIHTRCFILCNDKSNVQFFQVARIDTLSSDAAAGTGNPSILKRKRKGEKATQTLIIGPLVTNTNYLSQRNDLVTGDQNNKTQTVIFGTCFVYSSNMYIRF